MESLLFCYSSVIIIMYLIDYLAYESNRFKYIKKSPMRKYFQLTVIIICGIPWFLLALMNILTKFKLI